MDSETKKDSGPTFGVRHLQCLLLFSCQFVMYTVVQNIPLAIVAMTDSNKANPDFEEFDWDEQTRATILSSFFWGYAISQIPSGALAARFGGKHILLVGVIVNSVINLIMPKCTFWGGANALLALRIIQGVFQGTLYPSTHGLIASWAPVHERSRLSVLIYPGAQIGTVVALSTGGLVASSSLGWPGIFYIWGVAGIVWCVLWWWYGASSPMDHKTISDVERDYILGSTTGHEAKSPTPWRKILHSRAFYALLVTHLCGAYSFWTITTVTPTYLKGVFDLDIRQNALLSSIPPTGLFVMSHVFGVMAKFCTNQLKFTHRTIRVLFNSIGFMIPAMALVSLGFVTSEHAVLGIVCLTVAYGVSSAIFFGYYVNHMDLCPSHASVLMGVTNSIATISGIFATLSIGWLVPDESNPKQWQITFGIGAGLFAFGTLVFAFFGRFENQNWVESGKTSPNAEVLGSVDTREKKDSR